MTSKAQHNVHHCSDGKSQAGHILDCPECKSQKNVEECWACLGSGDKNADPGAGECGRCEGHGWTEGGKSP